MTTEERVWAYLVEANPIPDDEAQRTDQLAVAAYLDTLEQRSSDMTQLDTAKPTKDARRRGMVTRLAGALAVVAIAVAGVVIAQSGSDEPDVFGAEDLVGVWVSADGVYMQFNDDGTFSLAWSLDEVSAGTFETGAWTYDGTEFVWVTREGNCAAGEEGRYTIEHTEDGVVAWDPIWDTCLDRLNDLNGGPMTRVSS